MHVVRISAALALLVLNSLAASANPRDKHSNDGRPAVPWGYVVPDQFAAQVYDSKAEPIARATAALSKMNMRGWELIAKYFPLLGTTPDTFRSLNKDDPADTHFIAYLVSEEPERSPIPLISIIISLDEGSVSGPLKNLRDELVNACRLPDYSSWTLSDLRRVADDMTQPETTERGTKYRAPKPRISFQQAVQLYAITLELVRKETRWADVEKARKKQGYSDMSLPDVNDFANRLMHQLPVSIADGGSAEFFLYRPGILDQPVAKGEFEERADVVTVRRRQSTFEVQQFPVYLTAAPDWSPSWIKPQDEIHDSSLAARKYEYDWTRLDGPYPWFRTDQLIGPVTYTCTVTFPSSAPHIVAERQLTRRGEVMTARRDPGYDPRTMRPFVPGSSPSFDLSVNWPDLSTVSAPKQKASDLEAFFYEPGNREMLHYQPDPRTSITSLYPPPGMPEPSNGSPSKVADTSAAVSLPSGASPPHR